MARCTALLLLPLCVACSELSGANEFSIGEGTGATSQGGAAASSGGFGAGGGTAGGGATGTAGAGGVAIADGPFGGMRAVDVLSTSFDEDDPSFTADGLELFFNSDRLGTNDIWRSVRVTAASDWESPNEVVALNSPDNDGNVVVAPDGLTLWLSSNRGQTAPTVYVSTRSNRSAAWTPPAVDAQLPDPTFGVVCAVSADLLTMILHAEQPPPRRLYETSRASVDAMWQMPTLIAELEDGGSQQEAWMSPDSQHLYWGPVALWRARRSGPGAVFGNLGRVSEIEALGTIGDPWLSPDQSYIMFAVGFTPRDIYEARR